MWKPKRKKVEDRKLVECCNMCRFGRQDPHQILCMRFPTYQPHMKTDWCGEFKVKADA